MDFSYQYSESALPDKWRVLGVQLNDYSLGHALLLDRIQSPFVVGGDPGVDDIALTLLTCSQSYKNAVASMFKRTLRQKLWQWRFKLFARIRPLYVLESAYRIREYIRESVSSRPKFWKDSKRTRKTAAPDLLLLRVFLHTRFNYTDSEIMNMPYARANWEYYGWLEQEGAIEFRNPKDEAFFEKVRSEQKKMRDQNGVK